MVMHLNPRAARSFRPLTLGFVLTALSEPFAPFGAISSKRYLASRLSQDVILSNVFMLIYKIRAIAKLKYFAIAPFCF